MEEAVKKLARCVAHPQDGAYPTPEHEEALELLWSNLFRAASLPLQWPVFDIQEVHGSVLGISS